MMLFEVLSIGTEENPPLEIITRASLFTHSQIVKRRVHALCNESHMRNYRIFSLRKRAFKGTTEVFKMNQTTFALNVDINAMCFMFHPSTIVSGENECSGI